MYRPFTKVAVARGIFIISNLLKQKTDTNTILASHGVMSSLVKLFSVKFQTLTNIGGEVGASIVVQRNLWNEFSFCPLTDIIEHGWEKYIDPPILVVLPSTLHDAFYGTKSVGIAKLAGHIIFINLISCKFLTFII